MTITREHAEQTFETIKHIVYENRTNNYVLIRKSYHDGLSEAAHNIERCLARGDFDEVEQ